MAWEQRRNPNVVVGILNRSDFVYRDMLKVAFAFRKKPGDLFLFEGNKPAVDISRNIIASTALKEGAEWCFFLDDDVVAPPNVVQRLMQFNLPIISGLYWRRYPDGLWPEVFRLGKDGIPKPMKDEDLRQMGAAGPIECDAVGAGMLLIHRSVLEKMAPTVPKWNVSPEIEEKLTIYEFFKLIMQDRVTLSEDVVFCSRAKGLGFKVYCDLGCRAGHLYTGMIKYGEKHFPPLSLGHEI